jgi:hypothetical protein
MTSAVIPGHGQDCGLTLLLSYLNIIAEIVGFVNNFRHSGALSVGFTSGPLEDYLCIYRSSKIKRFGILSLSYINIILGISGLVNNFHTNLASAAAVANV